MLTTAILWRFFYKYMVFVRPTLPCLQHFLCKIVLLKVWFFQKLLELSLQLLCGMLAYQRFAYECNKKKFPSICHLEISSPCKKTEAPFCWSDSNLKLIKLLQIDQISLHYPYTHSRPERVLSPAHQFFLGWLWPALNHADQIT